MVIHIAVVEDEPDQLEKICAFANQYEAQSGQTLSIHRYNDGDELLEEFQPGKFDILLLDIQMRRVDGMTAARKIRAQDAAVVIMFITNIVQYAVQGYSVQALDFIVKPIEYPAFSQKLELAIRYALKRPVTIVRIKTLEGLVLLQLDDIVCVEIISRKIFIHTLDNTYPCNETLQGIEEKLNDERFYRCHVAYLVNLQHVRQIVKDTAVLTNRQAPISRHRYKGLVDALTNYLGKR